MHIQSLLFCALLSAAPVVWSGSLSTPIHVGMSVLERCQSRWSADAQQPALHCSAGVAKATVPAPAPADTAAAAPAGPAALATTSQPLPAETTPRKHMVAFVF